MAFSRNTRKTKRTGYDLGSHTRVIHAVQALPRNKRVASCIECVQVQSDVTCVLCHVPYVLCHVTST